MNVKAEWIFSRRIDYMSETKTSFMDSMSSWMEQHIVPIGMKIGSQRHLAAIRDGLAILITVTIIGGFAILIAQPPIPASITEPSNFFYAFLLAWKSFAGAHIGTLLIPYDLTIGIISLYVVCGVSYTLATRYGLNGINNMLSAMLVYLCVSGAVNLETASITIGALGAGYMFAAMITAILVVEIAKFFRDKNITIKMPDSVPPNVAATFSALLPLCFSVVFFMALDAIIKSLTGAGYANLIRTSDQYPDDNILVLRNPRRKHAVSRNKPDHNSSSGSKRRSNDFRTASAVCIRRFHEHCIRQLDDIQCTRTCTVPVR